MSKAEHIAVVGASGMLGTAFRRVAERRGIAMTAIDEDRIDLRNHDAAEVIERLAGEHGFDTLINCAAYTDVDGAETDEDAATEVNGLGVARLAAGCRAAGIPIIHFSTDYVFEGNANTPYSADRPRAPLNAYGRSKAAGEAALESSDADWLCVRTSWLYAAWGKNFVLTMAKLLAERDELKVVDDQRGRPTSSVQLAERSLDLLVAGGRGMWHLTDAGECTWCGLTRHIADVIGSTASVSPCTTDEFPRPARRPAYSVLDIEPAESAIGPAVDWKVCVRTVLADAGLSSHNDPIEKVPAP